MSFLWGFFLISAQVLSYFVFIPLEGKEWVFSPKLYEATICNLLCTVIPATIQMFAVRSSELFEIEVLK